MIKIHAEKGEIFADKGRIFHFHHAGASPTEEAVQPHPSAPWFTGPLITPSAVTVPPGIMDVEGYFQTNVITGVYDNNWKRVSLPNFYNTEIFILSYFGITEWMDVSIIPEVNYNRTQGISSLEFADFPVSLEFQLLNQKPENNYPDFKVYILETFPTGKYQKLKPERLLTDAGGKGSFQTELGIVLGRLFKLPKDHYLNARLNLFYVYWSSPHLKGINAYGGDVDTSGRIFPGHQFSYLLGIELTLTKNWVFALDAVGVYTSKTRFSGNPGTNPRNGIRANLMSPPRLQFSFAPGIEYNFNESFGIVAGPWFTVAGRNSPSFISGIIAFNYYGPVKKSWIKE